MPQPETARADGAGIELVPIGIVRNGARTPDDVPYNGAPSTLVMYPDYAGATAGLAPGFIWVITWLDQADRLPYRVSPTGARGSFSSRTPTRLNPVAITVAGLIEIAGAELRVDALDVCDGTPLLDVKPYVRDFDCVFGPADPAWRRASFPNQRLARLVRTIERFCGPLNPALALAARLALAADQDLDTPANSPELSWECACSPEVAGGIQAVSGAPLGSSRFHLIADKQRVQVSHARGRTVEYHILAVPALSAAVLDAPEHTLFVRA